MRCRACNVDHDGVDLCPECSVEALDALYEAQADDRGVLRPYPRGREMLPRELLRASEGMTPPKPGAE